MSAGLTQRRRNVGGNSNDFTEYDDNAPKSAGAADDANVDFSGSPNGSGGGQVQHERDELDDDDNNGKGGKSKKLTLFEEILLLGYKDNEGRLSFWNDNISYVLRGTILVELSLRNRINVVKEPRKRPFAERLIEVTDERLTGEVLLDEALRYIKTEVDSIGNWVDLLSGETWNLAKIGYQLKQVRERIAKGLVDKGVLRTDRVNYVFFDLPAHPLVDVKIKEDIVQRAVDCLLGRGPPPNRRTVAMVCAAYAANVLENALVGLSHAQREAAFQKADELLQEHANYSDKVKNAGTTEVMAGVFNVYAKMDSIL
ncbi:Golgi phosphoprotein 3-domain-containing protein [Entophlyctis helioformis]|nr:Golgi phosphoprotein 3-domain-containing protein [Entophlyctis helioformis]